MSILNPNNPLFVMARQGRRLPHFIVSILVLLALFVVAFGITGAISEVTQSGEPPLEDEPIGIPFLVGPFLLLVLLLWLWIRVYEKRGLGTLGFPRSDWLRKYCTGLFAGFGMVALTVGLMYLCGGIGLEDSISRPTGVAAIGSVALFLFGFMVQGGSEEVVFRGWMLQTMGARYRPLVGVIVSSLLFVLAHGSTNVLVIANLLLFSMFLVVYCLREGDIWGVCGWHASWNWAQGQFFGLEVSGGSVEGGTILNLKAMGSSIIGGGDYGPEGSLMCTPVLIAGILLILLVFKRPAAGPVGGLSPSQSV